jgi:ABC-type uncharacterized transport system auxiliary subunit
MKRGFVLIALALPLAACISILPKQAPPPLVYALTAAEPGGAATENVKPIVIAVESPTAPRTLSGTDIVWVKHGRLAAIAGASWDGRTPDLLQTVLIHTIDRAGAARGAVVAGSARADAEIGWDLINFAVMENGALEARFTAHVNLLAARDRHLISSLEIDERAPLNDRSSSAAAAALQEAARAGAAKIAAWAAAQTPAP